VVNDCVACPYHGWEFRGDGKCTFIPSQEAGIPIPARARVESARLNERHGLVWMCVGGEPEEMPFFSELEEGGYTLIHEMMDVWQASAPRIVDNALDVSHVAWVHRNSIGSNSNNKFEIGEVSRDGRNLKFSVTLIVQVNDAMLNIDGVTGKTTRRTTHAELVQPLIFRGRLVYEESEIVHVLYKTCTPIDDEHTLFCQFIARNDDPAPEHWESITAVDKLVQSEDRALLERIEPDFPLEITDEVHTKYDKMTVEYRRVLGDLAAVR
jgi:phenylpropionate dioxygenase-like ring-hydroxylating dioxygenase large terminal subunit